MALYVRPPEEAALGTFAAGSLRLFNMRHGYHDNRFSHWVFAWQSDDLPTDTYSVGLHLYDELGNFVGQTDFALPNNRPYSCITTSIPIENLAQGNYRLQVVVYNWQTGERLPSENGDMVQLGFIAIP
jgi:hypothetical protein